MPFWIILAVGAQAILATVAIIDKYIVSSADKKHLPRPFVYAFYTCLFSGAWVFIYAFTLLPLPFNGLGVPSFAGVSAPTLDVIALSLLSAYTFFVALVSLFTALRHADASDVVPVVGAVSAITTYGLSYLLLGTRLTPNFISGIVLLALGTFLVSRLRFTWKTVIVSIHAGIFFAFHYVAIKGLFNNGSTFDNGFFWSRIAFVVVVVSLLLVPSYLEKITTQVRSTKKSGGMLIVGNKFMAGIASVLVLKATQLGSVAVVQALGGVQFLFILLFGIIFGKKTPVEFGENIKSTREIMQKVVSVAIITLGFFVLFV